MSRRSGLSFPEILACLVIVASLAAFVYPATMRSVGAAKRVVCASNLRQLGVAASLYLVDYDDHYPPAINGITRVNRSLVLGLPYDADPYAYSLINDALDPYVKEKAVWRCPADTGRTFLDGSAATPALHLFNEGSSYFFAELVEGQTSTMWSDPSRKAYATDGSDLWHSPADVDYKDLRRNALFYDGRAAFALRRESLRGVKPPQRRLVARR